MTYRTRQPGAFDDPQTWELVPMRVGRIRRLLLAFRYWLIRITGG